MEACSRGRGHWTEAWLSSPPPHVLVQTACGPCWWRSGHLTPWRVCEQVLCLSDAAQISLQTCWNRVWTEGYNHQAIVRLKVSPPSHPILRLAFLLLSPACVNTSTSGCGVFFFWLISWALGVPVPTGERVVGPQLRFLPCLFVFLLLALTPLGGSCSNGRTQACKNYCLRGSRATFARKLPSLSFSSVVFIQDGSLLSHLKIGCLVCVHIMPFFFFRALFSQLLGKGNINQRFITSSFWQV